MMLCSHGNCNKIESERRMERERGMGRIEGGMGGREESEGERNGEEGGEEGLGRETQWGRMRYRVRRKGMHWCGQ